MYPDLKKARQRITKQEGKGIRKAGYHTFPHREGHPEKIVTIGKLKDIEHAGEVAEVVIKLAPDDMRVGTDVDEKWLADADVEIGPWLFRLELDRDTHNDRDTRERMKKYRECDEIVLWVAPTETRKRRLMELGHPYGKRFLFALFSDVVRNPKGEVWETTEGDMISLMRP